MDIRWTEIEIILGIVGTAAWRLKSRLELVYRPRNDDYGRRFSGLHETVLPLSAKTMTIFQQLRGSRAKEGKRSASGAANNQQPCIQGRPSGRITGTDMRHLLLLLPFLLFDLLYDETTEYNSRHAKEVNNPSLPLISFVLSFLEWYHLYRQDCSFV